MKFEWEVIFEDIDIDKDSGGHITRRSKVFGGWIVMNIIWDNEQHTQSESMVFVADPNHEWAIE